MIALTQTPVFCHTFDKNLPASLCRWSWWAVWRLGEKSLSETQSVGKFQGIFKDFSKQYFMCHRVYDHASQWFKSCAHSKPMAQNGTLNCIARFQPSIFNHWPSFGAFTATFPSESVTSDYKVSKSMSHLGNTICLLGFIGCLQDSTKIATNRKIQSLRWSKCNALGAGLASRFRTCGS